MKQMQGGGRGGAFSFGKSKAKMLNENQNAVTFVDVAGCEEAKEEVAELVDFLRDPSISKLVGEYLEVFYRLALELAKLTRQSHSGEAV